MKRLVSLYSHQGVFRIGVTLFYLVLMGWLMSDLCLAIFKPDFINSAGSFEKSDFDQLLNNILPLTVLYIFCIGLTFSSQRILVAVWLSTLYLFCVSLVVFSLSTYIFQVRVHSIVKANTDVTSPFISHVCNTNTIETDSKTGNIQTVDCLPAKFDEPLQRFSSAEVLQLYTFWKKGQTKVLDFQEEKIDMKKQISDIENKGSDSLELKDLRIDLDFIKANEKLALERIRNQDKDENYNDSTKGEIQREYQIMERIGNSADFNLLMRLFLDIESFENFFWVFRKIFKINNYWAVPKPILKINLVLCMGILGSLIFISIEFMKLPKNHHSKESYSMYFLRPFLGMIVALAMYVMVKSGQSTLLDSTEGDLSPFLLSFLGIISGMLAEQAYKRIALTGGNMLGESSDNNQIESDKGG